MVCFNQDQRLLKNFDGRDFIFILIDLESKLLEKKKKNLGILKFWRAYPRCLDIISLKHIYKLDIG